MVKKYLEEVGLSREVISSALIVKTSSLGDIIHTFPAITYLKKNFPKISIDWVVEKSFADLVQAHPDVNSIFCIDTKKWRSSIFSKNTLNEISLFKKEISKKKYDIVFDLQGNLKSSLVTWQAKSAIKAGYGPKTISEWPNLLFTNSKHDPAPEQNVREEILFVIREALGDDHYSDSTYSISPSEENIRLSILPNEEKDIENLLSKGTGNKILVCPGSNWSNKQISEHALCDFLHEVHSHLLCHFIFIWGSEKERQQANFLHKIFKNDSVVAPKFRFPALQNLMDRVDLVIAMDSLALHLAGTTSTKTFSLFGPSSAHKFRPYGPQHHSLQGSCPYGRVFERQCPLLRTCSTGLCLKGLSGKEIFSEFYSWWCKPPT